MSITSQWIRLLPDPIPVDEQASILQGIADGDFPFTDPTVTGGTFTLGTFNGPDLVNPTLTRAGRQLPLLLVYPGATAGWQGIGGFDSSLPNVPASQTGSTALFPVHGINVGDILTSFQPRGRIESAGGTVTVDLELHKVTFVAGTTTDVVVAPAMTQLSKTADFLLGGSAPAGLTTLTSPETVLTGSYYYFLATVTTGVSCAVEMFVELLYTGK